MVAPGARGLAYDEVEKKLGAPLDIALDRDDPCICFLKVNASIPGHADLMDC